MSSEQKTFGNYAAHYDLFYSSKDYGREVDFAMALASEAGLAEPASILDMGCGTAGHLLPLARERKIRAHGFDLSPEMISKAREKIRQAGLGDTVSVAEGDATSYRSGQSYELVWSMFAVMGYLSENDVFAHGLKTARAHLKPGGLFIFDVWHGPAVLHQLPETRVADFQSGGDTITRIVRPKHHVSRQCVDVQYRILRLRGQNVVEDSLETHRMRYFFPQELTYFLAQAGFVTRKICPFLSPDREPGLEDWNISVVAEAVK